MKEATVVRVTADGNEVIRAEEFTVERSHATAMLEVVSGFSAAIGEAHRRITSALRTHEHPKRDHIMPKVTDALLSEVTRLCKDESPSKLRVELRSIAYDLLMHLRVATYMYEVYGEVSCGKHAPKELFADADARIERQVAIARKRALEVCDWFLQYPHGIITQRDEPTADGASASVPDATGDSTN